MPAVSRTASLGGAELLLVLAMPEESLSLGAAKFAFSESISALSNSLNLSPYL